MLPRVRPDSATSTWKLSRVLPLTMATRSSSGRWASINILRAKELLRFKSGRWRPKADDEARSCAAAGRRRLDLVADVAVEERGVGLGLDGEGDPHAVALAARRAPVLADE